MAKVKIFVVSDRCGSIQYIGCNKQDAIDEAIDLAIIPSFEEWVGDWMMERSGEDLLDLLDETEPKVLLRDEYFDVLEQGIDCCEFSGFEAYEVDIPVEALLKTDRLTPEVLVMITNIFKS